jgi:hypothetical protein
MRRQIQAKYRLIAVVLTAFIALPGQAVAWNIPGHMLNGAITFQILRRESAYTIEPVKTILESHPWYANQWQAQLEKLPSIDREEILFMLAARWADDIRTRDKAQHREAWHHIDWPVQAKWTTGKCYDQTSSGSG